MEIQDAWLWAFYACTVQHGTARYSTVQHFLWTKRLVMRLRLSPASVLQFARVSYLCNIVYAVSYLYYVRFLPNYKRQQNVTTRFTQEFVFIFTIVAAGPRA